VIFSLRLIELKLPKRNNTVCYEGISIKLARHYEIPRTSEGQKRGRPSLNLMTLTYGLQPAGEKG
jgi:hypothetical protein